MSTISNTYQPNEHYHPQLKRKTPTVQIECDSNGYVIWAPQMQLYTHCNGRLLRFH